MEEENHMKDLFKWFVNNFEMISRDYRGKAVIVKDFQVVNVFENSFIANKFARENLDYGDYIIQDVSEESSCYITTIASAQFFE